jgi:cell division septation protein DedD
MDRNRIVYLVAFPLVTVALCAGAYLIGFSRGRQAALSPPAAPEIAVPEEHAASENLTFFKTLKEKEGVPTPGLTPPAEPQAPAARPAEAKPSGLLIQVSAFKDIGKAHEMSDALKNRGYPASIVSNRDKGQEWHRVYVGPFPDRAAADETAGKLERDGFGKTFVTKVDG